MAGNEFGIHDDAFGETGIPGYVLCDVYLPSYFATVHAGGSDVVRLLTIPSDVPYLSDC